MSKPGHIVHATAPNTHLTSDLPSIGEKHLEYRDEKDLKTKQNFRGRYLLWLAYQSIGIIYGDIGTSPLYVYSSTFTSPPNYEDLLGALSLIIWTLTLIVSIKYVLIVLRADDEGEGGTFAIYSLLSRYAHIVRRDPREELMIKMERVKSAELKTSSKSTRSFIEGSTFMKTLLKVVGVLGVSLVMSDGVLTPAQSVLGAIQGLEIVKEDISHPTIVGTSCAILVLLFLIQPLGTSKIATVFAPIVIIWLSLNFSFGIYNLVHHDHSVLKAFSPYFAGHYLVRNKTEGWKSLGGILLAFTGVEALFADLGAFSRRAIQISWLGFAYPCLLLAYIGQAAYISQQPEAYSNPFYLTVPPGTLYPSMVFAIAAAIVASQTMITATFQLLSQIIRLSYFPQIKLKHTSKIFHGQIYIPWANWLLMIGTVVVTVAYKNTTSLGQAYGVCVILVTFITTSMVTLVALIIWRTPAIIVLCGFLIFGSLDGLYLSAALTKVPNGAWFTLALAIILSSLFILWRFGKENQWRAEASDRIPPSHILSAEANPEGVINNGTTIPAQRLRLTPAFGGAPVSPIKGIGIFFDKTGSPHTTPTVYIHFLQKFQASPAVVVFFHLRALPIPSVAPEDRISVSRSFGPATVDGALTPNSFRDFFRITLRHGYTDEVVTRDLGVLLYEQLRGFVIRECGGPNLQSTAVTIPAAKPNDRDLEVSQSPSSSSSSRPSSAPHDEQDLARHLLAALDAAYTDQVVYVVGKEQMRVRESRGLTGWTRKLALELFLWLRGNTGSRVSGLDLEVEKLVEVGFVKEV